MPVQQPGADGAATQQQVTPTDGPFSWTTFQEGLWGPSEQRSVPVFEPPSLTPLRRRISESTIGVLTSCGARLSEQPRLAETNDLSYRLLPRDVPANDPRFVIDHMTPARIFAEEDLNVAYPRDRLVELEASGVIGRLADEAVSIVGSITLFTELLTETVPRIKQEFERQGVDVVLLVPF